MAATSAAHAADAEYLTRKAMTLGYQISSLLAPPIYIAFVLTKRGRAAFSVNRLLRATWIGGLGGSIASGGVTYAWYSSCNEGQLRTKRLQTAYDTDRIRAEDHAMIGTVLMSVLTPAILWNRAHIVNLILGGAGLGSTVGLLTHYGRSLSGDLPPKAEAPVVVVPVE